MTVQEAIIYAMLDRKVTRSELARRMGWTAAAVTNLLNSDGRKSITLRRLEKIAEALGCRVRVEIVPDWAILATEALLPGADVKKKAKKRPVK